MVVPASACEFLFKRVLTTAGESGSQWMFTGSRVSSTSTKMYENGVQINSAVTADTGAVPTNYYCSFARGTTVSTASDYSSGVSKYESFGAGFDATEALAEYNLVHAYQTALGRAGPS